MSPILVVEITYDFGLRIETGTERPLLLYTWYNLLEVSGKYNMIWVND